MFYVCSLDKSWPKLRNTRFLEWPSYSQARNDLARKIECPNHSFPTLGAPLGPWQSPSSQRKVLDAFLNASMTSVSLGWCRTRTSSLHCNHLQTFHVASHWPPPPHPPPPLPSALFPPPQPTQQRAGANLPADLGSPLALSAGEWRRSLEFLDCSAKKALSAMDKR